MEALDAAASSINNLYFKKIVLQIKERVENGEGISAALAGFDLFPDDARQIISIGENSGKLPDMLLSVAAFHEKERELFIRRFTLLLEPALTLIVGVVVGVVTLAMFMPMVNMLSKLQ